ncbi:hypothetical protein XM38_016640 [Halomicronema hongdechloris C2206]|uniref:Uncharacterized protein n=1 Tax=Halomicronema hongdechloris C2206 TaxID=1641165 RepID=A0A1Z3HK82_9CYAN|nr:hypothetical protein XM38_016640 [Halomicronema hongdechloris C2206]
MICLTLGLRARSSPRVLSLTKALAQHHPLIIGDGPLWQLWLNGVTMYSSRLAHQSIRSLRRMGAEPSLRLLVDILIRQLIMVTGVALALTALLDL